jgi:hypothetical protein
MNLLSVVLFLHVVGMLGLFVALGLDGVAVLRLRRSRSDETLTPWIRLSAELPRLYRASLAVIVLTGGYLTRGVVQGMTSETPLLDLAWLEVSVASLGILGVTGAVSLQRLRPSWRAVAATTGGAAAHQLALLQEPLLTVLVVLRAAFAIAIVFLMMNRPSLYVSLLVMVVAVVIGLASSGIVGRRSQVATAAGGVSSASP